MKSVVYLTDQPFDGRNFDRFGIQSWIDRGWHVEVWDMTPLAYPHVWRNRIESGLELKEHACHFPMMSTAQLEERLLERRQAYCYVDFSANTYHCARAKLHLSNVGAKRITCCVSLIPEPENPSMLSRLGTAVKKGPVDMLKWLLNGCASRVVGCFSKADFVIVAGKNSIPLHSCGGRTEILMAHAFDYDVCMRISKSAPASPGKFAVFLDQDYCFHPDYLYDDSRPYATPDKYFPAVCKGLRAIAEALEVDLRVAGHPRSAYEQGSRGYFESIPVERGNTAALVRDCEIVVGHCSAAIQLAVLFGKPVVFVTTDELASSPGGEFICRFASALGKAVINLDGELSSVNWEQELTIDWAKYAEYRNQYIKIDGSPEVPLWEIVIDHIEKQRAA